MSKEEMKEEMQKMLDEATKSITADKEYWKGLAGKWRLEAQARKEKIEMLDEATKSITADKEYWKGLAGKWRLEAQARKEKIDELESKTDSILDAVVKNKYSFLIFFGWSAFCFGFGFFVNSVLQPV